MDDLYEVSRMLVLNSGVTTVEKAFTVANFINEKQGKLFSLNEVVERFRKSGIGHSDIVATMEMLKERGIVETFNVGRKGHKVINQSKMDKFLAAHSGR